MELYNIRIINKGRNEYNGNIIIDDDNNIKGICTEKIYGFCDFLEGKINGNEMLINIHNNIETIPLPLESNNYFPKPSMAPATYFCGKSKDCIKDNFFVELINIKDIENEITKKRIKK